MSTAIVTQTAQAVNPPTFSRLQRVIIRCDDWTFNGNHGIIIGVYPRHGNVPDSAFVLLDGDKYGTAFRQSELSPESQP